MRTLRLAFLLAGPAVAIAYPLKPCEPGRPCAVAIDGVDLQGALDAAPAHSTLVADKRRELVIGKTIRVTKPVTITGLRARLRASLPRTPLMEVLAEGVTVRDFTLTGNISTVAYEDRASLIVLRRGRFVIANGEFLDSAKDGVMVTPARTGPDIEHGVIRDIIGRNNARDLVSIAGLGELGHFVRHILVENVRSYDSRDRGAAEASDGSEFITFRDIYSESSIYGIDVQDHNRKGQTNRHIVISGLHVRDCVSAVRTANHDFGHAGLVIRNVVGESFRSDPNWLPMHLRNTSDVHLENIRLAGTPSVPALHATNIRGLVVRDLILRSIGQAASAVHMENVDDALFDNVVLGSGEFQPGVGIRFRISNAEHYHSLRVRNCMLGRAQTWDLAVEFENEAARLDILVTDRGIRRARIDSEARIKLIHRSGD